MIGATQDQLLDGYCSRLVNAGINLQRVHVAHRTLHPVFGGQGFNWRRDGGTTSEPYARASQPVEAWLKSPFYYMFSHGLSEPHLPLTGVNRDPADFPILDEFRARGATDYLVIAVPFTARDPDAPTNPTDPGEGFIISWTTDAEGGFAELEIAVLRALLPALGLTLKSAAAQQTTRDLLQAYLGPDAGARVLSGEIQRGSLDTIHAVIWYFDLQGFTRLAETETGETIIALLNEYFGVAVEVIEAHGGNVLKFMGDGLLAIFSVTDNAATLNAAAAHDSGPSALAAVNAAAALRPAVETVIARRARDGLPCPGYSLALHAGDVMYGNIGAEHRLDFTIIGPAVNTAARILAMCHSLEQTTIVSARVAAVVAGERRDLIARIGHSGVKSLLQNDLMFFKPLRDSVSCA